MTTIKEIKVPDIGGSEAVEVIEIFISPGDTVAAEDALITLESDKASMDIPAPEAGTVKELKIKVGDKLSEGDTILLMDAAAQDTETTSTAAAAANTEQPAVSEAPADTAAAGGETQTVSVPDIGDFKDIPVIEILVSNGDTINAEDPMITLESDKSSMEIPAPQAGTVEEILLKVGDNVSQGTPILVLSTSGSTATESKAEKPTAAAPQTPAEQQPAQAPDTAPPAASKPPAAPVAATVDERSFKIAPASPGVRKFARELGANLGDIKGTGRKGRILKTDVQNHIKQILSSGASAAGSHSLQVAELPKIDFSAFGETEVQPLTKINKLTGKYLHRSWFYIPHVTQFDEADITELESFRKQLSAEYKDKGIKITLIAFLLKAVTSALQQFPRFNASLDEDGENLVLKKYYHIGVAVDTPDGLIVPVIKNTDQKTLVELAEAVTDIAGRARKKKITPAEMQGACITISSLGGVGGTAFTPIVNQPEVAILGVSRSSMKPVYQGDQFVPRLMLPLSLSYDHRVIDGVAAAQFTTYLGKVLADVRRLLL